MKKLFCAVIFILHFGMPAFGEWAPNTSSDVALDKDDTSITVKGDGTYTMEEERTFVARNENGRNKLALESVQYMPELGQVQILSAYSLTNGKKTMVNLKTIHERTAAGPASGITGAKELVIPFTNLEIGSKIVYRVKTKSLKPIVPGVFSSEFAYGLSFPELSGKVRIISEKKLRYAVSDSDHHLEISEDKVKNLYGLTIVLKQGVDRQLKDEKIPILSHGLVPEVDVTTAESWNQLATSLAKKYEDVLNKKLPSDFMAIAALAGKKTDIYDKLDVVTSELSKQITYSGNWTSPDRMFFPRKFQEVATAKTGDCKDYATSTVGILRQMGIQATVALVYRKNPYDPAQKLMSTPLKDDIPLPEKFNHAIVRIENPDSKVIWLDPTNTVSNSRVVFSDIADSYAMSMSPKTQGLERIPVSDAEQSTITVQKKIKVMPDDSIETEGNLKATGLFSTVFVETAIRENNKKADATVLGLYGSSSEVGQQTVQTDNYKSRQAPSFEAKIKTYGEKVLIEKEKKTFVYVPLPSILETYFLGYGKDRRSDLYTVFNGSVTSTVQVEGYDFDQEYSMGCMALSPWFDVERKLIKTEKGFEVRDKIAFKNDFIPAVVARSDDYHYSLGDLEHCVKEQAVQVRKLKANESMAARLEKFQIKELKSLNDNRGPGRNSDLVRMMAEQILMQDPQNKDVKVELARAVKFIGFRRGDIYGSHFLRRSEGLLDEVLQSDPNHLNALLVKTINHLRMHEVSEAKKYFARAYKNAAEKGYDLYEVGGELCESSGDLKAAQGSYSKAASVAKDDLQKSAAYRKLGWIFQVQKNMDMAEKYLIAALSFQPKDAWLMNDLVVLYLNSEKYDKAIELGERMLAVSDFGVGRENLANAYAHKALNLLNSQHGLFNETETQKAGDLAMKGLKWSPSSFPCKLMVSEYYLNMAVNKKDKTLLERSLDSAYEAKKLAKNMDEEAMAKVTIEKSYSMRKAMETLSRKPASN